MSWNREKVIVVESFGVEPELAAVVGDVDAPEPSDDTLAQFGDIAALNGDRDGNGVGFAQARTMERVYMFRERQLTAAQQAALGGLPVDGV